MGVQGTKRSAEKLGAKPLRTLEEIRNILKSTLVVMRSCVVDRVKIPAAEFWISWRWERDFVLIQESKQLQ